MAKKYIQMLAADIPDMLAMCQQFEICPAQYAEAKGFDPELAVDFWQMIPERIHEAAGRKWFGLVEAYFTGHEF